MTKKYVINGNKYEVTIRSVIGPMAEVDVNGKIYKVEIEESLDKNVPWSVSQNMPIRQTHDVSSSANNVKTQSITSPLPGVIVSINVKVGDQVRVGQNVAVLEAMKMENEIQSEYDGTVTTVNVLQGDSVLEGTVLITIA